MHTTCIYNTNDTSNRLYWYDRFNKGLKNKKRKPLKTVSIDNYDIIVKHRRWTSLKINLKSIVILPTIYNTLGSDNLYYHYQTFLIYTYVLNIISGRKMNIISYTRETHTMRIVIRIYYYILLHRTRVALGLRSNRRVHHSSILFARIHIYIRDVPVTTSRPVDKII
jgi:hypothetical protein